MVRSLTLFASSTTAWKGILMEAVRFEQFGQITPIPFRELILELGLSKLITLGKLTSHALDVLVLTRISSSLAVPVSVRRRERYKMESIQRCVTSRTTSSMDRDKTLTISLRVLGNLVEVVMS